MVRTRTILAHVVSVCCVVHQVIHSVIISAVCVCVCVCMCVLSVLQALCSQKIVFVLKEMNPEAWINDGGTDFTVHLKPPGLDSVATKVR